MRAFTLVMVFLTLYWISYGAFADEWEGFNLSWLATECQESFSDDQSTDSYYSAGICTGYIIASYELFVLDTQTDQCRDINLPEVAKAIEREVVVLSEAIGPERSKALPASSVLMAGWVDRAGCGKASASQLLPTLWL